MARQMPTKWLIDETLTLVRPDGSQLNTAIRVGFPSQVGPNRPGENFESSCWVHVEHLVELGGPPIAASTLSALTSALNILATEVASFSASGGTFRTPDGEDAALDLVLRPLRSKR